MNGTESSPHPRPGRVVVGVTGSPSSQAALRQAVEEARYSHRALVPVLAWEPPGGEIAYRMAPEPYLTDLWERRARERVDAAFAAALGGPPPDLPVDTTVVRGPAVWALLELAGEPNDLLVLGAGSPRPLARVFRGHVRRRAIAHARSPVLLVRQPFIPRSLRRRLRHITPDDFFTPAGGMAF